MSEEIRRPAKKMKLLISDLHLGRGRTLEDGRMNSFEEFYFSEKLVEFIQYYSTGAFRDYDVEIIINGDFLNFLQVDYRSHFLTAITESIAIDILKSIVSGHEQVFKAMGDFLSQPFRKITYIVGNHDQPMMFQGCRDYLDQFIGRPLQYKNIVYLVDGIHVEHGHMHEAVNRVDPRKLFIKQGLLEPILNLPLGSHFFIEFVLKVKEKYPHVDKVRPFDRMIKWALFNEPKVLFVIVGLFLKYFYRLVFWPDKKHRWSLTKVIKIFLSTTIFPDLSQSARKILMDERVHSVVFGHTHVYEYKKWGSKKEYFNTGTWTEITSLDLSNLGKITKLTYVMFDYNDGDQEPHGRLKEWKGFHRIEEDVVVA